MTAKKQNVIGSNLKMIREHLGYTQDDLAKYLNVSRPTISYIETGERDCSFEHLECLSELFNMDLADLLEEDKNTQILNCVFAFRTNELTATDLHSIADFQLIVKNYIKIKNLANG